MVDRWKRASSILGFDPTKIAGGLWASDSAYAQRSGVARKLSELMRLKEGWDGYRGRPLSPAVADRVHAILATCLADTGRYPSIVPGPSGDVQMEWHWGGIDLEVIVTERPMVEVWIGTDTVGDQGEAHSFALPEVSAG
nr:hypothetical protein [Neorhizobium tomejilense]